MFERRSKRAAPKWKEGAPPHGDQLATNLTPLLDKLPLGFRELLQVYYASVPDTQTAPRPNSREEMIDFLSHMIPRPDSLPPLFIFVERLAQQLSNQQEWDLYTMYKLCGNWKTILIDFSPEVIPACLSQNQRPQAQHNTGTSLFPSHS
jgi:NTP-dependent ternary conflict system VMAP-like protein